MLKERGGKRETAEWKREKLIALLLPVRYSGTRNTYKHIDGYNFFQIFNLACILPCTFDPHCFLFRTFDRVINIYRALVVSVLNFLIHRATTCTLYRDRINGVRLAY